MRVRIKRLSPKAVIPQFMTEGAACVDLTTIANIYLPPLSVVVADTGLAVAIPDGYMLEIRSRGGLATRGVIVANSPGTVDSDYRGEVKVILANLVDAEVYLPEGSRVAQARLVKLDDMEFEEVEELDDTKRGEGRFSSTGV